MVLCLVGLGIFPPAVLVLALAGALHAHLDGHKGFRAAFLLLSLIAIGAIVFSGIGGSVEGGLIE